VQGEICCGGAHSSGTHNKFEKKKKEKNVLFEKAEGWQKVGRSLATNLLPNWRAVCNSHTALTLSHVTSPINRRGFASVKWCTQKNTTSKRAHHQ